MLITWSIKSFKDLVAIEVYEILQLRIDVFMIEQNCLYRECDDLDISAWHLMGKEKGKIIAYARLLPAGLSYADPAIGRVVVKKDCRSTTLGTKLMHEAIRFWQQQTPDSSIRISAQLYLQKFYKNLGFINVGDPYLEDDIPHIEMLRSSTKNNDSIK